MLTIMLHYVKILFDIFRYLRFLALSITTWLKKSVCSLHFISPQEVSSCINGFSLAASSLHSQFIERSNPARSASRSSSGLVFQLVQLADINSASSEKQPSQVCHAAGLALVSEHFWHRLSAGPAGRYQLGKLVRLKSFFKLVRLKTFSSKKQSFSLQPVQL